MAFIRYLVVGFITYLIDMGTFLLSVKTGYIGPIVANIVAKLAGGTFGFFAHRKFTFRMQNSSKSQEALRYFSLLAIYIPFSSAVLKISLMCIKSPVIAKFISDIICIIVSYLLAKYLVFSKQHKTNI